MSARELAKEEFQKIARTGRNITLRQFANELPELINEEFSLQTIRMWSFEDGWFHGIQEIDSVELLRLTKLFDLAHKSLVSNLNSPLSGKDVAAYGRSLREVCAKIPVEALPYFEDQISTMRMKIYSYLTLNWGALLSNHSSSIMKTYLELRRHMIDSLVPELMSEELVDADAILMGV